MPFFFFLPFIFFLFLLISQRIVMAFCFSYLYIQTNLPTSAGPYFSTAQLLPLRLSTPGLFCDKTNPSSPWFHLQGWDLSELQYFSLRCIEILKAVVLNSIDPAARGHGHLWNWVKHPFAFLGSSYELVLQIGRSFKNLLSCFVT